MIKVEERTEDRIRLVFKPSWWWAPAFVGFGLTIPYKWNADWLAISVGLIFLIAGIVLLFEREECLLDKRDNLVLLKRKAFPSRQQQYRLSDVAAFFVSSRYQMSSDDLEIGHHRHHRDDHIETLTYGLEMRLKSGLEIPLCCERSSFGIKHRQKIVAMLENFRKSNQDPNFDDGQSLPLAQAQVLDKVCVICRLSCENAPRLKDDQGNYYHSTCYNER